ncbi:MAG TPA: ABC transporter substrate-binding protein [Dehalococcoidia bacterium]|nr:ABC transporter substrate-binding protein [Dehalococcoidia bacterium]
MTGTGYWPATARRAFSRRRLIAGGAGLAGSAALLAACGRSGGPAGGANPAGTAAKSGAPKPGGQLHRYYNNSTTSLSPITDSGERLDLAAYHAYDRLVSNLPDKDYVLQAAQTVELPDPATVIFKLKPGMTFHNRPPVSGRAVTPEDIAKSQYYVRDNPKAGNNSFQVNSLQTVETPDAQTVVFRLKGPNAYLFSGTQLADPGAQCVFPKENLDNLETAWTIGSGPYELVDYQLNVRYLYRRFAGYHEASKGLPYIDEREVKVITDAAAQESAFRSGQVDLLGDAGGLQPNALADTLKRDMGDRIAIDQYLALSMLSWNANVTKPPWNDVRIREAMYRLINRDQYLSLLEQGKGKVPPGPLPAGLTDYQLDPKQTDKYFHQDAKAAKQLLDAAGFPYDKEIEIITINNPRNNQGGEIYQQQLAPLGVKARVVPLGTAEFLGQRIATGNWETFVAYWPGYDSPQVPLRLEHTVTNHVHKYAGLKDPTIDKMIEKAEVTTDKAERIKLVKDIQIALLERYTPMIYLENYNVYTARYNYVRDYQLNPATVAMYRLEAWLDK